MRRQFFFFLSGVERHRFFVLFIVDFNRQEWTHPRPTSSQEGSQNQNRLRTFWSNQKRRLSVTMTNDTW